MDLHRSSQDVLRCHLCKTPCPPLYCDVCHTHLCKACVGEHISNKSDLEHKVVLSEKRGSTLQYPKCQKHSKKQCELFCDHCNIPICAACVSSKKHKAHTVVDISKTFEAKKVLMQKDLHELKNFVYPNYQEIATNFPVQITDLNENTNKLTIAIEKHGEDWHREIEFKIMNLKSDLAEMKIKHMGIINKQKDEITGTISEITNIIDNLTKMLNSNDISIVSAYVSRIAELRRPPSKLIITLPSFTPQKINKEQIHQQFGSLSVSTIKMEEYGGQMDLPDKMPGPLDRPLIDEPKVITDIKTEFGGFANPLYSVCCLSDKDIWTCGWDNILRLYNLQGELVKSIKTYSKKQPQGIAVAESGELVYTDRIDRTVNIVKNTQIQEIIKFQGWRPRNICITSSGDYLVIMDSDDFKQSKVVRYIGSTEKKCFQYNDKGQPLYTSNSTKYVTENMNLDICVADWGSNAIIVVNKAGDLRFTYSGPPSTSDSLLFSPRGITTDSQCRILTVDSIFSRIHILDQDGEFLRFIDCDFRGPWGVCLDSKDNLFVAEDRTGKVIKVKYSM